MVEDYDAAIDSDFIKQKLTPYFTDLYKDLLMRSNQPDNIDKVTFIEYTKLPGIINDISCDFLSKPFQKSGRLTDLANVSKQPKESIGGQEKGGVRFRNFIHSKLHLSLHWRP